MTNLSDKRKLIKEKLEKIYQKNLKRDYVSYGTFQRLFLLIKRQDKEFIQKLKERIKLNSDAENLISYGEVFEIIEEKVGKELSE